METNIDGRGRRRIFAVVNPEGAMKMGIDLIL